MIAIGLDGLLDLECAVPFAPIYLNEQELFCVVDHEDHAWAMRWRWSVKWDRHRRKAYAVRTARVEGIKFSMFLHKEICWRAHGSPPSPRHHVADHCDGKTLNIRRSNLRWATPSENRQNINGWWARQMRLQLEAGA